MTPLPLPSQTLAWLKHAADSGSRGAQALLHLLARADKRDRDVAEFVDSYSRTIAAICRRLEALERGAKDLPAPEAPADDGPVANALLQAEAARDALKAEPEGEGLSLQWTDNMPPSEACRYDHCIAETPFGRFLITWKSWKEYDDPTVDETPWGDRYAAFNSVDNAKAACQQGMNERLARCGTPATPPAPEPGPTFQDAIRLAEGCHDYSGGHSGAEGEAWHGAIDTVVAALKKATDGPWDSQTRAVYGVGVEAQAGEVEA
jgi:hypothetical protein